MYMYVCVYLSLSLYIYIYTRHGQALRRGRGQAAAPDRALRRQDRQGHPGIIIAIVIKMTDILYMITIILYYT